MGRGGGFRKVELEIGSKDNEICMNSRRFRLLVFGDFNV